LLRDEQADVLTTYDPNGGYGHPDHLEVHHVGRLAAELAGTPMLLEATINRDLLRLAADLAPTLGFEVPEGVIPDDQTHWFAGADEITHHIDVTAFLDQKRASMAAHASQTTSDVSTTRSLELFLSLPDDLFAAAFGTEWFIDRHRLGANETDVFAAGPSAA
jgi:LmbE family N-acetylglucosaminyl deacetylase